MSELDDILKRLREGASDRVSAAYYTIGSIEYLVNEKCKYTPKQRVQEIKLALEALDNTEEKTYKEGYCICQNHF